MDETFVFKKLVKYKGSNNGYVVTIQYKPSSSTHIIISEGCYKENNFFLKRFTPVLIRIFGEPFISLLGNTPDFLITIVFVMFFLLLTQLRFELYIFVGVFITCLILIVSELKIQFSKVGEYYRDTLCEKCKNEFSCEETEIPEIREVSTPFKYSIQVTRYWKCMLCGNENIRKSPEGFVTEKGTFTSVPKIACKKCGKKSTYMEYKETDKKTSKVGAYKEFVTRRYYRCKLCKHEDIKAFEEDIYPSDPSAGPSGFGYDIIYEDC